MLRIILGLTLSTTLIAMAALAQDYPALQGKPVVDQADIIPAEQEAAINARLFEYEHQYGHQLAVVTIKSLEGGDIETYAEELFERYGLGNKDVDDGVLLLIAPNDRELRIEVGYGLEPVLTDALASQIITQSITPLFKEGDMPAGIDAGVTGIIEATSRDQAYIDELREKKAAADAAAMKKVGEFFMNALIFIFTLIGGAFGLRLLWWLATMPRRRREAREAAEQLRLYRIEQDRIAKEAEADRARRAVEREAERVRNIERQRIADEERARRQEAARIAEEARIKKEADERAAMLAAMTPVALAAFLAKEEAERKRQAEIARLAAEEAQRREAERIRLQRIRDDEARVARAAQQKRDDEDRRRRQQEDDDRRRRQRDDDDRRSSSYSSSSSSDTSSSFSGGGGDSGGGGSSGSW